ncbi:MAG: hypothetical protein AAGA34_01565 [Pseudomonadota bacterium]
MRVRTVRWLVAAYMVLFLSLTTWPGVSVINSVTPLVLGLPFNLFCIAVLIVGGLCILAALYASERRSND